MFVEFQILTEGLMIARDTLHLFSNIQSLPSVRSDSSLCVAAAQLARAVVAVGHCCCQLGPAAAAVVGVVAGLRSLLDAGHGGRRGLGDDGAPLAQAGPAAA